MGLNAHFAVIFLYWSVVRTCQMLQALFRFSYCWLYNHFRCRSYVWYPLSHKDVQPSKLFPWFHSKTLVQLFSLIIACCCFFFFQNWPHGPLPWIRQCSGTPPYDHPVYTTTSLLRPYSFDPNVKITELFYFFEDLFNTTTSLLRPGFYGPTVVTLNL